MDIYEVFTGFLIFVILMKKVSLLQLYKQILKLPDYYSWTSLQCTDYNEKEYIIELSASTVTFIS